MDENNYSYNNTNYLGDFSIKVRDLEERQRIMKDRLLLIGKNLIELREKNSEEIIELKKDLEILKDEMQRIKSFLQTISEEFSNFARKEDIEILAKQAKMFQPLQELKEKK